MPSRASRPDPEIIAPVSRKSAEPAHYRRHEVLYHHGERAGNGHYMIDVLNQNGNGGVEKTWARIDNKVVSAERHEDLFGGHGNERVDDLCVFMLFYCCTALGPTQT